MNTPHDEDTAFLEQRRGELEAIARIGKEMELFLNSESWQTALTMVRGEIFADWTAASSTAEREKLHAEQRAMERLRAKFKTIDEEGVAARHQMEQINEALNDEL